MSTNTSRKPYTRELLEPIVRECVSIAEVLRRLGKPQCGGIHTNLSKRIKALGIDTSHFLGRAANCGDRYIGNRKKPDEVLIVSKTDRRESAVRLRRALIEIGRPYCCELCGQHPTWNGKELRLQVDHIDGNWLDNRECNLRFICPNCHSQTDNHSGSTGKTGLVSINRKSKYYYRPKK